MTPNMQLILNKMICEEWSEYPGAATDWEKMKEAVIFLSVLLVTVLYFPLNFYVKSEKDLICYMFFQIIGLKERIFSRQTDKVKVRTQGSY